MSSSLTGSLLLCVGLWGEIASMKQRFFVYLFHLKKYGPVPARDKRSAACRGKFRLLFIKQFVPRSNLSAACRGRANTFEEQSFLFKTDCPSLKPFRRMPRQGKYFCRAKVFKTPSLETFAGEVCAVASFYISQSFRGDIPFN
ncbi:hypothetical protein [Sphingobacterium deserti]|uniref:Uncharacterized protein n=1 Tax=Sphingobacterium deserti TaxID=1229276 RepID=A0A0B8T7Y2_9SPHI|nr:hypothetical protein [Sphingobacterium deserti]KGE13950.1 hypothetical protein DI53_2144 [Sphingobacterium deserti]